MAVQSAPRGSSIPLKNLFPARTPIPLLVRSAVYFGIAALVVLFAIAYPEYRRAALESARTQEAEALRLSLAGRMATNELKEVATDLRMLAGLQTVQDFLGRASAENRQRVERQFANFAENARRYDQIRLLDPAGQERIRVNYRERVARATAPGRLHDKSGRYYVRNARELGPGEIYFSPIDLNVEGGVVERPFKPTIRVATLLFDRAGQPQAIVALNYLAANLLARFREVVDDGLGEAMLLNADGYWLYGGEPADIWGFMSDGRARFADRYPVAWASIADGDAGVVHAPGGVFVYRTLYPYRAVAPARVDVQWKAIVRLPDPPSRSPLALLRSEPGLVATLLALTAVLSALLAWLRTAEIHKKRALVQSERRLAEAQALSHLGHWEWDIRTNALAWSDEIYRIFGREPQEFAPTYPRFLEIIHLEDRDRVAQAVNAAVRSDASYAIEHGVVLPDGQRRTVYERGKVARDESGAALRMIGTVQDITERKQAEQELRATEERFRELVEQASDGIFVSDLDGRYIEVNGAACRMSGYARKEILGKTILDLLPTEDAERLSRSRDGLLRGDVDVGEWRLRRRDGTFLPVEVSAKILPDGRWQAFVRDISMRKHAERQLRESEEQVRLLLASVGEGVFGVDLNGRCTFINPEGLRLLGYADAGRVIGADVHSLIHHTRADGTPCLPADCRVYRAFREGASFAVDDEVFWRADGASFEAEYHSRPIIKDGRVGGAVATFRDITVRRRYEDRLRQAAIVFQSTNEAIIVTDADNRITMVNRAYTDITGYEPHEVIGQNPRLLKSGRQDESFYQEMWQALQRTGQWQGEIWDRRKDGQIFPAWENVSVVKDDKSRVVNYVAVLSDISPMKHAEEKLRHLAHHDALTGLPNRLLFSANLEQAIELARRHRQPLALMFLDLDRFKRINDTLGHPVGDRLLQIVGERLRAAVRAEDTVARLGGDEFTVVLSELGHPEEAATQAAKLIKTIGEPMIVEGHDVTVGVSVGIAVFPDNGADAKELIKAADTALYRAKERGRNTHEFYAPELTARALEHLELEQALRAALARGEFALFYQPEVALPGGGIIGVEALLRWHHPDLGLLEPETFMSVAEDSGLIVPIGEWVLRTACRQAVEWRARGLDRVRIAINLSGRQVVRPDLVPKLAAIMRETGANPDKVELELEITESVLHRVEQSRTVLEGLKALGVRLAVDDFGAGYSSLAHLQHLPIDTLKIDRSFVSDLSHKPDAESIVAAMVALGHGLRLEVVGEGVETAAQRDFLETLGCDYAQGYLYGRAVPPETMAQRLDAGAFPPRRARPR